MAERNVLKWSGDEIIQFLDIYQKYDVLWNVWDENYGKKNAREHGFDRLVQEVNDEGLSVDHELLKKKIKSLRDAYRLEVYKIKRSKKSGAGTEDIHKPKLIWFEKADSFWRNVASGRESSSNLVSSQVAYSTC